MPNLGMIASGALVLAFAANGAVAETFMKYGEVEGWKVFADTEKGSCLIEKIDEVGNVVQMGLTEDRGVGYVGVFTLAETGIKKDDKAAVAIAIGENLYIGSYHDASYVSFVFCCIILYSSFFISLSPTLTLTQSLHLNPVAILNKNKSLMISNVV